MSRNARALLIIVPLMCLSASVSAQSPAPPHVPLQKTIGQARQEIVPSLIVMNARSASLQGGTLTLTGVAPSSIVFADRPVRAAGHSLTTTLLEEWSPANTSDESFAKDPPNATISVFSSDGSKVQDAVVVLKSPSRGRPADLRRRCARRRTDHRRRTRCGLHRPLRFRWLRRLPWWLRRLSRRLWRLPRRVRRRRLWPRRLRPRRRGRRLEPTVCLSRRLVSRCRSWRGGVRRSGARGRRGRCGRRCIPLFRSYYSVGYYPYPPCY